MSNIFGKALIELNQSTSGFKPINFQNYADQNHLQVKGTAQYISVQSFSDLAAELKENQVMVFRLGSKKGEIGTSFGLAKVIESWTDYFLFDEDIFNNSPKVSEKIDWLNEKYLPFRLIPKLTETSHVNLALATRVIQRAFGFQISDFFIPATGRGSYSFEVRPHEQLPDIWEHHLGQVEIDSLLVGIRDGQNHLLVIEAKSGKYPDSLAKYKLVYPVLSILPALPKGFVITPIYIRIYETENSITFFMAECLSIGSNKDLFVNQLIVKSSLIFELLK